MNEFDRFIEDYLFGKHLELPFNSYDLFKNKSKDMTELLGKSSFEPNGDNLYVATFSFGINVTSDMVDVEVNDEERMITVSYSYKENNSTYSSAVILSPFCHLAFLFNLISKT